MSIKGTYNYFNSSSLKFIYITLIVFACVYMHVLDVLNSLGDGFIGDCESPEVDAVS